MPGRDEKFIHICHTHDTGVGTRSHNLLGSAGRLEGSRFQWSWGACAAFRDETLVSACSSSCRSTAYTDKVFEHVLELVCNPSVPVDITLCIPILAHDHKYSGL